MRFTIDGQSGGSLASRQRKQVGRRETAFLLTFMVFAVAIPAMASEGHFEGQAAPIEGKQACSVSGMRVTFQLGPNGEVLGGAVTPASSDGFHGTIEGGRLHASFHEARHAELVTIDGILSGDQFEGVVQRAGCRYRLTLKRH
jgi:hypothetical protein